MHSTAVKMSLAAAAALLMGGAISPAQAGTSTVPSLGSAGTGSMSYQQRSASASAPVQAATADAPQPVWGPATISWTWFRSRPSWHSGPWFVPVTFKTRVSMQCNKRGTKVRATLYVTSGNRTTYHGTTNWKPCNNRTHSVTSTTAGPTLSMRVRIDQTGPDASVKVWEKLVYAY
ncbi:hypothetical protein ACQEU3_43125 [Spirillospora sp. CA-253888]